MRKIYIQLLNRNMSATEYEYDLQINFIYKVYIEDNFLLFVCWSLYKLHLYIVYVYFCLFYCLFLSLLFVTNLFVCLYESFCVSQLKMPVFLSVFMSISLLVFIFFCIWSLIVLSCHR